MDSPEKHSEYKEAGLQDSFERTATRFGISRENWEHPTVRRFVEAFNRL